MKLTAHDRKTLRQAAVVADAQKELIELQKSRAEGRPAGISAAGPLFAVLFASMAMIYFSVLAITSERQTEDSPVFLSSDIEQPLPRG
jgi:hypothetical protein